LSWEFKVPTFVSKFNTQPKPTALGHPQLALMLA